MQTAYLLLNVSKIDKYLQLQESSSLYEDIVLRYMYQVEYQSPKSKSMTFILTVIMGKIEKHSKIVSVLKRGTLSLNKRYIF